MSRASRPVTSMPNVSSAWASFTPAAADPREVGLHDVDRARRRRTLVPALLTTAPSTLTRPARISARARSREAARPSSTRRTSRRVRGAAGHGAAALRGARRPPTRRSRRGGSGRGSVPARAATAASAASRAMRFDALEAEQGRVGRLAGGRVLAGGLAERPRPRPRRRGCRRRSGTRGRAARRSRSTAATRAGGAPAMMAPATAAARMSAPVLRACMSCRPSASSACRRRGVARRPARSIAWPPTMPAAPAASAMRRMARQLPRGERRAGPSSSGSRASSANASVSRPSPARIAMPSP